MSKNKNWSIDEVINKVSEYMDQGEIDTIKRAYEFAKIAHKGQVRKSGEEYIVHPIQVAGILADLHMDFATISAGLLHDVVEDTGVEVIDIQELFDKDIALIVDGVTKISKIKYKSSEERLSENHRKLLLAMGKDIRVMIVKLADRLHNMRTLKSLRPEKQRRISRETLEIYAPIADRLGIGTIKWELEDTALHYLNPQQYYRIVQLMNSRRDQRVSYIDDAIEEVNDTIDEIGIKAEIYGRPKHIYSIYRKMVDQHKQFNQIYDLLALRIIVNSIKDCYAVLGAIHSKWKPMPGRFKDYIAMPKANMYQSLHTTVIGPEGKPLEVQIRTEQMHQIAEFGIAAHWAYKEGNFEGVPESGDNSKLNLVKQIIELQEETDNAADFMDGVKGELFGDRVYVFTPKGDVYEMPKGAGPLDLAYMIHTDVGHHTTGAKINGKIVPLDHQVKNGDIVDIVTSSNSSGPSQDWLKLVHTRRARNKIKQFYRQKDRDVNIELGMDELNKKLHEENYDPKEILTDENLETVAQDMHYQHADDLLAAIGFGDVQPTGVINRLTEELRAMAKQAMQNKAQKDVLEDHQTIKSEKNSLQKRDLDKSSNGIYIDGVDNLLVRLSHCCTPVPGDDILGYITKGRGVSVHRKGCPNMKKAEENGERVVAVFWASSKNKKPIYTANLSVEGYNRSGLIADVIYAINNVSKNVTSINGKVDKNKMVTISLSLMVRDTEQLERAIATIRNVSDVYVVSRAFR
ncbi:RelA/SpoT family protein [Lentilactobacillus laojiaonis]|uniref:RelA/SpoT family protein n=1 Tax=Lentilactobacillus laojiaonis TaxID=2883998 RepID=UPI001D0B044A|nr:bifunctional (p)ppGpp synthetase/guanosine-3',5'-bis(diphosphate) 3'-pyrophosphohydrolase [Lentilactobacillus laojiaonis]UDM31638.1 bifunctional (p)ppGpp synthetase/guanosine-3',5'-bis(diphosphate) 3'-pyrophosphohydrolase [Lentilactobacillus laojiaonis]